MTCQPTSWVFGTVAPRLADVRSTRQNPIPAVMQMSRYAWVCKPNREHPTRPDGRNLVGPACRAGPEVARGSDAWRVCPAFEVPSGRRDLPRCAHGARISRSETPTPWDEPYSFSSLAIVNCADAMQRGPHFGLGKPATELRLTRSADALRYPCTQGGACVRCTHARLPWAALLNAFSVARRRVGRGPERLASAGRE